MLIRDWSLITGRVGGGLQNDTTGSCPIRPHPPIPTMTSVCHSYIYEGLDLANQKSRKLGVFGRK